MIEGNAAVGRFLKKVEPPKPAAAAQPAKAPAPAPPPPKPVADANATAAAVGARNDVRSAYYDKWQGIAAEMDDDDATANTHSAAADTPPRLLPANVASAFESAHAACDSLSAARLEPDTPASKTPLATAMPPPP